MSTTRLEDLVNTFTAVISKKVQLFLREKLYLVFLVNRDHEDEVKKKGNKVEVPVYGTFQVQDVPEDGVTKIIPEKADVTKKELTLDEWKGVAVGQTDLAHIITNGESLDKITKSMVGPLAEYVERYLASLYASFSHTINSQGEFQKAGTTGNSYYLNLPTISETERQFNERKVPGFDRYLLASPFDKKYMLDDEKFTKDDWVSDKGTAIKTGYIGNKYGFGIFDSNMVPRTDNGVDTYTYHNIAFHKEAITLASRPTSTGMVPPNVFVRHIKDHLSGLIFRLMMSYDHLAFNWNLTMDVLFGAAVMMDDFALDVVSTEKYA